MGKIKIVNKQGVEMYIPEKLAGVIGGVKPKILDKPPELQEVIKPLEPVKTEAEPVKAAEAFEPTAEKFYANDDLVENKIEPLTDIQPLAEPKPSRKPVKKNVAARKGGKK